ncbi:hypothetical protein Ctha_2378 [Chloroherpeton thalassium ATCC 35110]|uniref:DUF4292 domain-containing protein n=1 Tax=Chloroherpeton thalassium (strain ATCC 35110 / GB-78) TaxID=517418 RepID=B3QX18_CHLT3|nr:DUF4292 domain-containing protein [Chloroherpeton thalassium]ACF14828.1 hypothetical protein Ctha_2378 [Chloroherpeton thalassium ATCC 35110]
MLRNSLTRLLCVVLVFATLMSACSSSRTVSDVDLPGTQVSVDSAIERLLASISSPVDEIKTVDGNAEIWIKTPEMEQSLSCNIKVKRGEAIQIVGSVFFGITVLEALIREDSIFVHNLFSGQLLVGKNSAENLKKAMGLGVTFEQMTDAFIGIPSLNHASLGDIEQVTAEKGKVGLYLNHGGQLQAVVIDSSNKRIESIQMFNEDGKRAASANYKNFENLEVMKKMVALPKVIEFISYQNPVPANQPKNREIVVAYAEREINGRNFGFDFKVPKGASVINIDNMKRYVK